ncbi:unnamed protein product [Anisakis simplex]|uniref:Lipase domain-containing protein n=1 Tax=Anisakis simplex TaxID=6269 RepID=A0A0M3IYJ4_ANISI|nr:unnamed protein product [Anisakis simplex]
MQAAANTRVMGALMAHLIKLINRYHKISYDQISIVGFSLGAHAAGFAGKRFSGTKLKAIYGGVFALAFYLVIFSNIWMCLDPAGPLFSKANPNRLYGTVPPGERLSRTDAQYVQVFHTSGDVMWRGGAGTLERLGDEDYYVNGGRLQLGCSEAIGATAFALRALLSTDLSNDCNTKVIAGYTEDPPSINKTSESSTFYFDTLAERFDENGFCAELFCLQVTTNVTSEASVDITIRNNQGQSLYSTQVRKGSARYMNFTANETQSIIVALPRGFVTVENYTVTVFAKYSHKSVIARNETLEIPAQTTLVDGDGIASVFLLLSQTLFYAFC